MTSYIYFNTSGTVATATTMATTKVVTADTGDTDTTNTGAAPVLDQATDNSEEEERPREERVFYTFVDFFLLSC